MAEALMGDVSPVALVNVAVIALATILCWSFWGGRHAMRLYFLSAIVLGGLIAAGIGQLLQVGPLMEPANALAIGFAFAGCSAGPSMWREEIRKDLERAPRLYTPFGARDLLSWQALLKVAERLGSRGAAGVYLLPFVAGLVVLELTVRPTAPFFDRTFIWIAHAPIAAFALLSAWYLYRAARRLVPGA